MNVFRLFPYGLALGVVFLANCHLRMIRRRRFVEYHNILVLSKRHFLGIEKSAL